MVRPETLDRAIAARFDRGGDDIAVIDGDGETTYRHLFERALGIADVLRRRGVRPGMRVGVCSGPSSSLVAAIVGIWAAGAAYVALDPTLPKARLDEIREDARIDAVVAGGTHATRLVRDAIVIDDVAPAAGQAYYSSASLDDVAYVVYTSGSTGRPKGIEIEHAGMANAIREAVARCSFRPEDRALYRTSIGFDLSIYDLFCPLLAGATIVICPPGQTGNPRALIDLIVSHRISTLLVSPGLLGALLDEPAFARTTSLRAVTSGGEALSSGVCRRFFDRSGAELYNLYGPSEASMLVTLHRCVTDDLVAADTAPIGRALPNTHVSVRDPSLALAAPGSVGEIVIGGIQLARGYIDRPQETADRFVPDPADPSRRIYRTGDLASVRHDGALVFLGRNDKQLKIRGQRVEPEEVAAAIERLPTVRSAAVIGETRHAGTPDASAMLIAFAVLTAGSVTSGEALRLALRDRLPDAMVPAEIVVIDAFPETPTGKVDEAALVRLHGARRRRTRLPARSDASPERAIVHEQVRALFEVALEVGEVGDYDDFFELGGDSLLALKVMLEIDATIGPIPPADFFRPRPWRVWAHC